MFAICLHASRQGRRPLFRAVRQCSTFSELFPNAEVKRELKGYVQVENLADEGEIKKLVMNRAPANALDTDLLYELTKTLQSLQDDKNCKAVVITSALPKIFSGGLDIMEMYKTTDEKAAAFWRTLQTFWLTLYESPLVTIAAINGAAPAGGCLIAASCDRRVMAEGRYTIGLNETKLGIVAPFWFRHLYALLIGNRVAERALVLGTLFPAEEAKSIGLVDHVVPADQLIQKAVEEAEEYLLVPDSARRITKQQIRSYLSQSLRQRADMDVNQFVGFLKLPEVQQGLEAYVAMLKARKG